MKKSNAINGSIDFIESRLTEAIDIGELAQQAFFSKTHYQRLFRVTVGEPVMEYVKNRRLQLACRDVRAGSTGILDIALKYGYDSHEGFTRAIDADYAKLCGQFVGNREHMITLMNEAVELLNEDIKQEAANCIEACIREVHKAALIGGNTAASAHIAAKSLDGRGRAFFYIAKEVSASINVLQNVTDGFKNPHDLSAALSQLVNTAYGMNINGFNASVETAREGNPAECLAATEKIMKYTGVLQTTYHECEALCSEYGRLMELTKRNARQHEHALSEKHIDDIIFQSRILSSQFALESERINRETFRVLTQTAITADTNLVKTRNAAEYREAIAKFLKELNREVSAMEFGGSFAYFAKEYEYFLNRI